MFKRLVICVLNIIFPPLAVCMITGLNEDVIFNSLLFLLAIIPSHIHGFYISLTYFNRKRKVRKGIYPGTPRRMIYSEKVQNGGASRREMERLKQEKEMGKVSSRLSRKVTNVVHSWDDGNSEKFSDDGLNRQSTRLSRRSR